MLGSQRVTIWSITWWSLVSLERLRNFFPSSQKKEVVSKLKNEPVKITFKLSRELQTTSPDCLRYYNILFRRYLREGFLRIQLALFSVSVMQFIPCFCGVFLTVYTFWRWGIFWDGNDTEALARHVHIPWVSSVFHFLPTSATMGDLSRRSNRHQLCISMLISF